MFVRKAPLVKYLPRLAQRPVAPQFMGGAVGQLYGLLARPRPRFDPFKIHVPSNAFEVLHVVCYERDAGLAAGDGEEHIVAEGAAHGGGDESGGGRRYNARMSLSPAFASRIWWPRSLPTRSVRKSRSTVISCETLATESRGRPESCFGTSTLPGASTNRRLDVKITATTVWMRLRLKASLCTTSRGRRKPGSAPRGAGRDAHQISPRSITTLRTGEYVLGARPRSYLSGCLRPHRRHRVVW